MMTQTVNPFCKRWAPSLALAIFTLAGLATAGGTAQAQLAEIYQRDVRGSAVMVGNSTGRSGALVGPAFVDEPGRVGSVLTFINDRNGRDATSDNAAWGDYTTGDWRESYSYTYLDLASLGGVHVQDALLIWSGSCISRLADGTTEDVRADIGSAVTLEYPTANGSNTLSVSPDEVLDLCADPNLPAYVAWANISALGPGWLDGWYAVGGVPATQGVEVDKGINFGGWTLVVVYEDQSTIPHQVTVWGGWRPDSDVMTDTPTHVEGFCYPDTSVTGRLMVTAAEGDGDIDGDQFLFGRDPNLGAQDTMSGPHHPVDNFFASQVTDRNGEYQEGGVLWEVVNHAPGAMAEGARQGWDIADVEVVQGLFGPGDEDAYLLPYSTGDSYSVVAMALDLPTESASFEVQAAAGYTRLLDDLDQNPDGVIDFRVTIRNVGDHEAFDVVFSHPVPQEVTDLNEFSFQLGATSKVSMDVTLDELRSGVNLPVDVPAGAYLTVFYQVTVNGFDTSGPIDGLARFDYDWQACSQTKSDFVRSDLLEVCQDGDMDSLCDAQETLIGTDPNDADTDNDGVLDGLEPGFDVDSDGDGLVNSNDPDSDNDGLLDGTEMGLAEDDLTEDTDLTQGHFIGDQDGGATVTDPTNPDTDGGGVSDGAEDTNLNGAIDDGEMDPNDPADDQVTLTDSDGDGIPDATEEFLGTDPNDADTDNDGVLDGLEPNFSDDTDGDGLINSMDPDSDGDGLLDGTEAGLTLADLDDDTDVSVGNFREDQDPTTTTNPLLWDTDGGGVGDGIEDANLNGRVDADESDPNLASDDDPLSLLDTDGDGLPDATEELIGTDPNDADSDNDGVIDGDEPDFSADTDGDGLINAMDPDSDDDGILDGTEMGLTEADLHPDTDVSVGNFVPDADPTTTTKPLSWDTDGGGLSDGYEDANHDGRLDDGEQDPLDPTDDSSAGVYGAAGSGALITCSYAPENGGPPGAFGRIVKLLTLIWP